MPDQVTSFKQGAVRGFLYEPARPSGSGLVLTHGAGGNCTSPLLVAVANAFASVGFFVLRFDLPFRQRRAFGPPYPSISSDDRNGIRAATDAMRPLISSGRIIAGGHSYGGRQTTLLAAEDHACCDALLLLSYPLHPPKKPSDMRTAHFAALQTPALFVHGTVDPFGSPNEMQASVRLIPSRTRLVFIDGAGHDLNRGKFDIPALVIDPLAKLL